MSEIEDREKKFDETLEEANMLCEEETKQKLRAEFNTCVDNRTREERDEFVSFKNIMEASSDPHNLDSKVNYVQLLHSAVLCFGSC